jgi:hypothetical protein
MNALHLCHVRKAKHSSRQNQKLACTRLSPTRGNEKPDGYVAGQHETRLGLLPLASRVAQRLLRQVRPWIEPAQSFEKNQLGLGQMFFNSLRLTWQMIPFPNENRHIDGRAEPAARPPRLASRQRRPTNAPVVCENWYEFMDGQRGVAAHAGLVGYAAGDLIAGQFATASVGIGTTSRKMSGNRKTHFCQQSSYFP